MTDELDFTVLLIILQAFLNQLKEMLLDEGLELYREGKLKDSLRQFNEGINLCAYMKKEGIVGHSDGLEKLLIEKASIQLNSVR